MAVLGQQQGLQGAQGAALVLFPSLPVPPRGAVLSLHCIVPHGLQNLDVLLQLTDLRAILGALSLQWRPCVQQESSQGDA